MSTQGGRSGRRGRGRQRVNMARMENESNLQVTFSKRRAGLFKKASELGTLCGVDIGLIVFSPGEKAFSFGHPNINAVCDRFLSQNNAPAPPDPVTQLIEAHRSSNIVQRNLELTEVDSTIESLKKSIKEKDDIMLAGVAEQWFPPPIHELEFHQLQHLLGQYTQFKTNLENELLNPTNPGNIPAGTNPGSGLPVYGGPTFGYPGLDPTHFGAPNVGSAASFGGDHGVIPSHYMASGSDNIVLYDPSNPSGFMVPAGPSGPGSSSNAAAAPYVPNYGMASSSRATAQQLFDPRNPSPGEGGGASGSSAPGPSYGSRPM
ncbi:Agamous-like MADS-box protein AGL62 [Abeliophyllum distichum]|uniref:Agamous-like MADS-box protein AGL62 n=1 Tax=Abeliophyllum distichum TaxID=126358 RepID=A0ABD1P9T9_9LAMI